MHEHRYRRGQHQLITAEPACGKSTMLVAHVCEMAIKGHSCLVISAEEPTHIYLDKLAAQTLYRREKNKEDPRVRLLDQAALNRIHFVNVVGPLVIGSPGRQTANLKALERIVQGARQFKPDFVAIETLAAAGGGDESNTAMNSISLFMGNLAQELNAATLLIHHDRKTQTNTTVPSSPSMDSARGGSSLMGSVRAAYSLKPITEKTKAQLSVIYPELFPRQLRTKAFTEFNVKNNAEDNAPEIHYVIATQYIPRKGGLTDKRSVVIQVPFVSEDDSKLANAALMAQQRAIKAENAAKTLDEDRERLVQWIRDCEAEDTIPNRTRLRALPSKKYGKSGDSLVRALEQLIESGEILSIDYVRDGKTATRFALPEGQE
jgi:hypothetical protein